jgi:hypothetical protein
MLFTVLIAAAVTAASAFGAIALFRIQGTLPTWARVLTWIAIIALALLAFAGIACTGCATLYMFGRSGRY